MNATIRGEAQRVRTEMVSGNYYDALGVRPPLGRAILPSDDASLGQGPVAVISCGLWEREFARSPAALGQVIKLNNIPLTIVGVNPRGFTGAQSTLSSPDLFARTHATQRESDCYWRLRWHQPGFPHSVAQACSRWMRFATNSSEKPI